MKPGNTIKVIDVTSPHKGKEGKIISTANYADNQAAGSVRFQPDELAVWFLSSQVEIIKT